MVHLCKMMICPCIFFIFWKFWLSALLGRYIGKKWSDWEKIVSCSISQEPYIIRFSFMLNMCKLITFQNSFLFFQNFDFPGCSGEVKGKKNSPKWKKKKKFCLYHSISQGPYIMGHQIRFHVWKYYILGLHQ